jgi:O-antigen ligase
VAISLVAAVAMPRNLLCPACASELDLLGSTFGRFDTIGQGQDLRTLLIRNAVPIVRDHPVLGVGPGRYGGAAADIFGTPIYEQYGTVRLLVDPAQRTVDDFWLHLLVETGVIGAALFVAMILAALRPIVRGARATSFGRHVALAGTAGAVISLSLNAVTTMLLEANSVAFLFWAMLGIGSQLALFTEGDV